jgi:hypothetical protein
MWPSSPNPPRRRNFAAVIATIGTLAFGAAVQAQTVPQEQTTPGSFCPVAQLRVNGVPGKVLKEELWAYKEATSPNYPVFGSVEMLCANTGIVAPIDIAKRVWFAVVGPPNAPAKEARIRFKETETVNSQSSVGVVAGDGPAKRLTLIGNVSPGHDCVFVVSVWSESCSRR